MKYSKEQLIEEYQKGTKLKYLFFWGHKKSKEISSSCFSQWWVQDFEIDGIIYPSAEHFMMAEKARLFKDLEIEQEILISKTPAQAKKLGRKVRNFNQEVWEKHRMEIVVKGNFAKFDQNHELKTFLLKSKKRILIEASPVDSIWGIGLDRYSEFAAIPVKWRGLNLLGFALMEVRDMLLK